MACRSHEPYETGILHLIDKLYESAVVSATWPTFLKSVCEATHSRFAGLLSQPSSCYRGEVIAAQYGLPVEAHGGYPGWSPRDVYTGGVAPRLRNGRALTHYRLSKTDIVASRFYREFLSRHAEVGDITAARTFLEPSIDAVLVLYRASDQPDYAQDDHDVVDSLMPHLRRAIAMVSHLSRIELERAASTEVLDRLARGIFLLDEAGRVVLSNATADGILADADGLSMNRAGVLTTALASETARMHGFVDAACVHGSHNGVCLGGGLRVYRPSGQRPYVVFVSSLILEEFASMPRRPSAVVFVTDVDSELGDATVLRRIYGLTGAETRVAGMLARGSRVADIVEHLGVSEATARTHVHHVLAKADADGQADLVRILVSSLLGTHGGMA